MQKRPLIDALVKLLQENEVGLRSQEIRRAILLKTGRRARRQEIEDALKANPRLFVGLANGIWRLRAVIETEEIVTTDAAEDVLRAERGEPVTPYFAHLQSLDSFVAFDLETTGVHADRDQIIQIAAVRTIDGQPTTVTAGDGTMLPAVFNEYVSLAGKTLPYSLRVKLGFTEHPEWEEALTRADSEEEVAKRFRRWVGELPLVAHNAHFDHSFIKKASEKIGWKIPQEAVVDTLELACIARPDLDSFKLEALARKHGIGEGLVLCKQNN